MEKELQDIKTKGVKNISTPVLEKALYTFGCVEDYVIDEIIQELDYRDNKKENGLLEIIPFSMLPDQVDEEDWILENTFCKGGLFTFSAYNKTGKTIFLTCMYKAMSNMEETFIEKKIKKVKTLHISEEYIKQWSKKKNDFKSAYVDIAPNTLGKSKSLEEWEEKIKNVLTVCKQNEYEMVVFDTLDAFWPAKDENAAEMSDIIEILKILTKEDICVVAVMHTAKNASNSPAKAARGSSALNDRADGIIAFNRVSEENITDNRRKITVLAGRFVDESWEDIIEFDNEKKEYKKVAESTYDLKLEESSKEVFDILPLEKNEALCVSHIRIKMNNLEMVAPKNKRMIKILNKLYEDKKIDKEYRRSTYYYWKIFNDWKEVK